MYVLIRLYICYCAHHTGRVWGAGHVGLTLAVGHLNKISHATESNPGRNLRGYSHMKIQRM